MRREQRSSEAGLLSLVTHKEELLNSAFRIWASLASLAIIVQVGLAAYGAFNAIDKSDDNGTIGKDAVSSGFDAHAALGYAIVAGTIILIGLAIATRRAAP